MIFYDSQILQHKRCRSALIGCVDMEVNAKSIPENIWRLYAIVDTDDAGMFKAPLLLALDDYSDDSRVGALRR